MTEARPAPAALAVALVVAGLYAASPVSASAGDHTSTHLDRADHAVGRTPSERHRPPAPGARAATAVVVGQTGTPAPGGCPGTTVTWTQQAVAAAPTYTVPGAGVITSFSTNANATAGSIRGVMLAPGATPTGRVVLGYTDLVPVIPSTLNTFPARIMVPAGASLGLFFDTSTMGCASASGNVGDVSSGALLDPAVSTTYTPVGLFPGTRLNLSAIWEPDTDADGFGDVTQDACPQSKLAQAACSAPDTTLTKAPKRKSAKRKAKITFTSTIAGSTFTCAVDKLAAKPCTSPFKKKFKYGKHTVVITATSPVGIVDATPVTVEFKVKKRR